MKKVINTFSKNLKLALSLLFIVHCSLFTVNAQQTFLDTLQTVVNLCGEIKKYKPFGQAPYFWGIWNVDDIYTGDEAFGCDISFSKSYLTFDIQSLINLKNQGYGVFIDSAKVRVYSGWGVSNSVPQTIPTFGNIQPPSVADHIDIGAVLDTTDWTAGNIGDVQTISSQIDTIVSGLEFLQPGFKFFDTKEAVQFDIGSNSIYSQYRLSFLNIESDSDCFLDGISFLGPNTTIINRRPKLIVSYTLFNYGDLNSDSLVTELDAQMVLDKIVSDSTLSDLQLKIGDVDGNGKLQVEDASLILQYSKGLITQFPVQI